VSSATEQSGAGIASSDLRPVAILQHDDFSAPGYFEIWLQREQLPYEHVRIDQGAAVPSDPHQYSGLCLLGGAMSVNDPLPWIVPVCELIRAADAIHVPVIGHCLGGQLLARALGASVTRNPVKEIGWSELTVTDRELAKRWLGEAIGDRVEMFQWHGDTFALPSGARNFLASPLCATQAYVIERKGFAHIGMQFHCEMTPPLVRHWCADPEALDEIEKERRCTGGAGVQSAAQMTSELDARVARMNQLAARIYHRWSEGLAP